MLLLMVWATRLATTCSMFHDNGTQDYTLYQVKIDPVTTKEFACSCLGLCIVLTAS